MTYPPPSIVLPQEGARYAAAALRHPSRNVVPQKPLPRRPPSPLLPRLAAHLVPDHPGYYEGIVVSGSRVFSSGAIFAALAIALGGGHLTIAAIAALPFLTRLSHLAVPELIRRYGSPRVAMASMWLERTGLLAAAVSGAVRPEGWAIPGLLLGIAVGFAGQNLYDASLASLHSETTTPKTFGRYTAIKTRWASIAGLILGVLASVAVDATEHLGVAPHVARSLAVAAGVGVHMLVAYPVARMRRLAIRLAARQRRTAYVSTPPAGGQGADVASWLVLPRTPAHWATVRFAVAWGFALGISTRQGEAMAMSLLGISVGTITLLNAVIVGAGVIGAQTWGRLADRFGGKGLLSISLIALALDPLWLVGAMLLHPILLLPSYALWGIFNSGWNIAQSLTLIRTSGPAGDRIRALVMFNVAFGLAAGVAPMFGGALLELLDARTTPVTAYVGLFVLSAILRLATHPLLRGMPAPPARRGRYVTQVVLRAARRRVRRRAR